VRVYPPQRIATPLTVIRRERLLPVPGEVLAQEGSRVEPVDVVARAGISAGFRIVSVSRALRVPASSVRKYLKVKPGDKVKKGQVIAATRGLIRRSCRSPIEGTVTGIGGGRILIEAPPREIELRANLYGEVVQVLPERGVVLQANGVWVQGVWGNDQEGSGILRTVSKSPDAPLRTRDIDVSCRGMVLIGGSRFGAEVLERAVEVQVRGIICGGILPEAIPQARTMPFPIVITDGIGTTPMCAHIYRLLTAHDGREAMLDGRFRSRWGVVRPEIIVPLPAVPEQESSMDPNVPLAVGDTVRLLRTPRRGVVGKVEAFPVWIRTPVGSRLPAAKVRVEGEAEPLLAPLINLEVLR